MYMTKKLYETFSSKCFNLTDDYVFMKLLFNHEKLPNKNCSNFQRHIQDSLSKIESFATTAYGSFCENN